MTTLQGDTGSTAADEAVEPVITPAAVPPDACTWPVSYASCQTCADGWDPADQALWEQMASEFLNQWTGGMYGECPTTVRPCREDCGPAAYGSTFWGGPPNASLMGSSGRWTPVLVGGQWYNVGCGTCGGDGCSCVALCTVALPGPVASVQEVLLDGVAVPPADYYVDGNHVVWAGAGECPWPVCQDLRLPPTEVGTFAITYTRGQPVPVGGQIAAGILACELSKAACGDKSCALPARLQSITRQGVTVTVLDSFEDIEKGRTGIWLIDSWVASVTKVPSRARVRSVDVPVRHWSGRGA